MSSEVFARTGIFCCKILMKCREILPGDVWIILHRGFLCYQLVSLLQVLQTDAYGRPRTLAVVHSLKLACHARIKLHIGVVETFGLHLDPELNHLIGFFLGPIRISDVQSLEDFLLAVVWGRIGHLVLAWISTWHGPEHTRFIRHSVHLKVGGIHIYVTFTEIICDVFHINTVNLLMLPACTELTL